MYCVYGDIFSGNCYKIKLLLELLQIEHEWKHVDILAGETHTEQFLAKNQNAKIPVLQIDDSTCLSESNAILNFLAEGSSFLPDHGIERARVLQWQFFEQYSHEPYIAVARYINKYLGMPKDREAEYHAKQVGGHKALQVMSISWRKLPFWLAHHQPLPTSACLPTPRWPTKVDSIFQGTRKSLDGWKISSRYLIMSA